MRRISAYLCLAAGLAGVLLPILPGIPLLIVGYKLLDRNDWLARRARRFTKFARNEQS
ncbi:MAG TPA: hypothetical protein VGF59_23370 [Bryobacteraceae bacterium]